MSEDRSFTDESWDDYQFWISIDRNNSGASTSSSGIADETRTRGSENRRSLPLLIKPRLGRLELSGIEAPIPVSPIPVSPDIRKDVGVARRRSRMRLCAGPRLGDALAHEPHICGSVSGGRSIPDQHQYVGLVGGSETHHRVPRIEAADVGDRHRRRPP